MDDRNQPNKQPLEPTEPAYGPIPTSAEPLMAYDPLAEPDTTAVNLAPSVASQAATQSTLAQPGAFDTLDTTPATFDSTEPDVEPESVPNVATEPATQPMTVNPGVPPVYVAPAGANGVESSKPPKKGLRALIVAAAVVLVFGGGSALAYTMYYQNPQKVVTDAVVNIMRAKTAEFTASLTTKSQSPSAMNVTVVMDGAGSGAAGKMDAKISATIDGKTYGVTAAGVFDDKGDIYFKIGDIKKVVDEFSALLPVGSEDAIEDVVAKIDNKWIKVDAEDVKDVSEQASKTQTCMTDAINKFKDDKVATKQVGDLYRANQFIVIDEKLGSRDGSLGYVLSTDEKATRAFVLSLKDTNLYKDLNKCDDSFKIDDKMFDEEGTAVDASKTRVELWIDRWSHQITELSVVDTSATSSKTVTTVLVEPVFNKEVTVETPKGATTIQQLQKDIEALTQKYAPSSQGLDDDFSRL